MTVYSFRIIFFQPKNFLLKDDVLEISYLNCCDDELEYDFETILTIKNDALIPKEKIKFTISQRVSKDSYLEHTTKCYAIFKKVKSMKLIIVWNFMQKMLR